MSSIYEVQPRFSKLFTGLDTAFGTGKGSWVKRPPRPEDFVKHLQGEGPGIGIAPLRPDDTVLFAAIDLDEPDFKTARAMQEFIPGPSFIERSRSGNAHVWVFFSEPCEAWVAMGVLREATVAAGKKGVEVFPKNWSFARVKLGNYINLPYHGDQRPILRAEPNDLAEAVDSWHPDLQAAADKERWEYTLADFLDAADETKNDPEAWRRRARLLLVNNPADRKNERGEFGTAPNLHQCAEYIIGGEAPPITDGHRNAVMFALAKQLSNWSQVDHDEAFELLRSVNEYAVDKTPDREILRVLENAERGQYTSTGCDDPLFAPYAHPNCPIANAR